MALSARLLAPLWAISLGLLGVGLYYALVASPPDYQQGETVRIMYVHVPAATHGDVRLFADGGRVRRGADPSSSAGRSLCEIRGAHRRRLHFSRTGHRRVVGQADVGRLVGLGRAADIGADPVFSLSRLHGALGRHRGAGACRARGRGPGTGRRDQCADHSLFGRLVEHVASVRRRYFAWTGRR